MSCAERRASSLLLKTSTERVQWPLRSNDLRISRNSGSLLNTMVVISGRMEAAELGASRVRTLSSESKIRIVESSAKNARSLSFSHRRYGTSSGKIMCALRLRKESTNSGLLLRKCSISVRRWSCCSGPAKWSIARKVPVSLRWRGQVKREYWAVIRCIQRRARIQVVADPCCRRAESRRVIKSSASLAESLSLKSWSQVNRCFRTMIRAWTSRWLNRSIILPNRMGVINSFGNERLACMYSEVSTMAEIFWMRESLYSRWQSSMTPASRILGIGSCRAWTQSDWRVSLWSGSSSRRNNKRNDIPLKAGEEWVLGEGHQGRDRWSSPIFEENGAKQWLVFDLFWLRQFNQSRF